MKSRLPLFARPRNSRGYASARACHPPRKENYLRDGDSSRPIRRRRHDSRGRDRNGNDPRSSSPRSRAPSAPPRASPFFSLPPGNQFFFSPRKRARARTERAREIRLLTARRDNIRPAIPVPV